MHVALTPQRSRELVLRRRGDLSKISGDSTGRARPKRRGSWGFVENKRGFIANNFRPSNMSAGLITLDIAYTAYMSRMAARQLYIYE